MSKIKKISSHKILNSRGDWTIETEVLLEDGSIGIQAVPEGASKGENEAISISAEKAVEIVETVINDALAGEEASEQETLDEVLIQMDGTPNKSHLGGNSILSVSLAISKASAVSQKMELYEYLSLLYSGKIIGKEEIKFPTPVFNILNGGKHARNGLSFQEFMVIPSKTYSFEKALEIGDIVYHDLKANLEEQGYETGVGDEGGFAPEGFTSVKAFSEIRKAAKKNFKVGEDLFFGMDAAAESFYNNGKYCIEEEALELDRENLLEYYKGLQTEFQLIYLEDPFYEKDTEGWKLAYGEFSNRMMLVADDLAVTNVNLLDSVIQNSLANAVIVKPNQVGTLTETLRFIKKAKEAGMSIVISHRSGDTGEDSFIADLAVAVSADFLKAGAPVRGERVVKYNRVLEILNKVNTV
jgi:enolase